MSMFFMEVDQSEKTLRWVRTGHEPAAVFAPSGNKLQDLYGQGIALGVIADYYYAEYSLQG